MSDLIDRQAAIDALADYIHNVDKVMGTGHLTADDCKDAATSVFEELPSVQTEVEKDTNVPINDCISRQAAIEAAVEAADKWDGGYNYERQLIIEEALSRIPSAERKKGKWIESGINYKCPFCHEEYDDITNWSGKRWKLCPMCGARLGEDDDIS